MYESVDKSASTQCTGRVSPVTFIISLANASVRIEI